MVLGNRYEISSHALLGMDILILGGLNLTIGGKRDLLFDVELQRLLSCLFLLPE